VAEDVHLPDPGRLRELLVPGARLWLRPSDKPGRKTRWTAALVEGSDGGELVSLDTTLPNRLISRALRDRALPELGDWRFVRSEVSLGRSRLDFLLSREGGERMAMEVKSVSLVEDGVGCSPMPLPREVPGT
jgi:sugar fermentation stimulation protein A